MNLAAYLQASARDLDERYERCPECERRGRLHVRHLILHNERQDGRCSVCAVAGTDTA